MSSGHEDRKARLAQALRDNLRRRKVQAREEAGSRAATSLPATSTERRDD